MQQQDGNKQFNISERLESLRREHEALQWEGSFRDYFELVAQQPRMRGHVKEAFASTEEANLSLSSGR